MTDVPAVSDPTPCRVGLLGAFDVEDFGQAVYAQVVRAELARRLPAAGIKVFVPDGPARPTRADRGEPAEAWSPARAAELDLVVVGGDAVATGVDVRWHVPDPNVPHPAVLLRALFPAPVLERRLEYLRVMGWYPREGDALVVQGDGVVAGGLDQLLEDNPGLTPVVVQLHEGDGAPSAPGGRHRLPPAASAEDVVAAIAASAGFVGSSPVGCLTALCYGRPSVQLAPGDELDLPDAFARAVEAGSREDLLTGMQAKVAAWLDQVAAEAAEAARSRHPERLPDRSRAALEAELDALRRAHQARVERSYQERAALADHAARAEAQAAALAEEVGELRQRAANEAAERARFESELNALRNTRTFRWTDSARSVYRVLRGRRR